MKSVSLSMNPHKTYVYQHEKWNLKRNILHFLLKYIAFTLLVKLDRVEGLENIPEKGPGIIFINHIAFVDPIVVLYIASRFIIPLAKVEVYRYPIVGIFPKIWGVIPVQREGFDRQAIIRATSVLNAGEIILVAPEGTRRKTLSEGKEGLAYLATRTGAPLIPCAITDTVGFPSIRMSKRWRGEGAKLKFGKPFCFKVSSERPSSEQLRLMTTEAMYILAAMLPEYLRGCYHDSTLATQKTIEWL